MLAVIDNTTELCVTGPLADGIIAALRSRFNLKIVGAHRSADAEAAVPIRDTEWFREMDGNRHGNLLAGARLKAGLTQKKLAEKTGFTQSVISDYERGTRAISRKAALTLSDVLDIPVAYLTD